MCIAALFRTAKKWKYSKHPPLSVSTNNIWFPINGILLSNRKEWNNNAIMWITSKVNAKWKIPDVMDHFLPTFTWNVQKRKIYKNKNDINGCLGLGLRKGINCNRYEDTSAVLRKVSQSWGLCTLTHRLSVVSDLLPCFNKETLKQMQTS